MEVFTESNPGVSCARSAKRHQPIGRPAATPDLGHRCPRRHDGAERDCRRQRPGRALRVSHS
jgi:hypothetical protein